MNQAQKLSVLTLTCLSLAAAPASGEVVFVDYDAETVKAHGDFPSRAALAELVSALHGAGAKAVILKFFLDGPGKEPDNTQLAEAIGKGRTVLQATVNTEPPTTRELPARFRFPGKPPFQPAIQGDAGWLPLARFSDKAARVCFADVRSLERLPMLEIFGGHPVPSLYACLLAEERGKEMRFSANAVEFGTARWPTNAQGEVAIQLELGHAGRLPALRIFAAKDWQSHVRGKVAVLMYTGPRSPTLAFRGKQEKVHDLFAAQVGALLKSTSRK
ncbi:MAG: CHASE2 domain-containing protein [Betaproteobacteria bacterium]|nr:CHASE2 domain-containing protein [Betaproteobacteria bacterium]